MYVVGSRSVHATEELILYMEKMNIAPFDAPTNGHVVTWCFLGLSFWRVMLGPL